MNPCQRCVFGTISNENIVAEALMSALDPTCLDTLFIDNENAREYFVSGLYDIEVMGPVSRLVWFAFRKTPEGLWIRETAVTCVAPTEALGPAIAMSCERLPNLAALNHAPTVPRQH